MDDVDDCHTASDYRDFSSDFTSGVCVGFVGDGGSNDGYGRADAVK